MKGLSHTCLPCMHFSLWLQHIQMLTPLESFSNLPAYRKVEQTLNQVSKLNALFKVLKEVKFYGLWIYNYLMPHDNVGWNIMSISLHIFSEIPHLILVKKHIILTWPDHVKFIHESIPIRNLTFLCVNLQNLPHISCPSMPGLFWQPGVAIVMPTEQPSSILNVSKKFITAALLAWYNSNTIHYLKQLRQSIFTWKLETHF